MNEDQTELKISAMCRNDKKMLNYVLKLNLWDEVMPTERPIKAEGDEPKQEEALLRILKIIMLPN